MCFKETFIFQKVAHAGATAQNQLGDVLDDLAFRFGWDGGEPLGETNFACGITGYARAMCMQWIFAYPGERLGEYS